MQSQPALSTQQHTANAPLFGRNKDGSGGGGSGRKEKKKGGPDKQDANRPFATSNNVELGRRSLDLHGANCRMFSDADSIIRGS